jgi:hypothetical protein
VGSRKLDWDKVNKENRERTHGREWASHRRPHFRPSPSNEPDNGEPEEADPSTLPESVIDELMADIRKEDHRPKWENPLEREQEDLQTDKKDEPR